MENSDIRPYSRPTARQGLLVTAAVLAGLVVLGVWDRSALAASLHAVAHLRWGWLALALAVEGLSVLAAARGHQRLLAEGGARVPLRRVLAISTASAAIAASVPLAGLQTAAAYSFRQYRRRGIALAVSGWAFTVAWMLVTLSLVVLMGVGVAVSGSLLAALAGAVASVVFLLPPLAALLALRFPSVRRLASWSVDRLVTWSRRLTGRPRRDLARTLDAQLSAMAAIRLRPRSGAVVFAYDLAYWIADVACLALAIRATGAAVPWQGLLLAYGAGIAANGLGLTPGGIGVVEAALSAALAAAGMGAGNALGAVLAFRLVGFWVPLAVGWVVFMGLSRVRRPSVSTQCEGFAPSGPPSGLEAGIDRAVPKPV